MPFLPQYFLQYLLVYLLTSLPNEKYTTAPLLVIQFQFKTTTFKSAK